MTLRAEMYHRRDLNAYECLGCMELVEIPKWATLMVDGVMDRVRVQGNPEHLVIWLEMHSIDHEKCAEFQDAAKAKDYRQYRRKVERSVRRMQDQRHEAGNRLQARV